jgi:hypothetical protein
MHTVPAALLYYKREHAQNRNVQWLAAAHDGEWLALLHGQVAFVH